MMRKLLFTKVPRMILPMTRFSQPLFLAPKFSYHKNVLKHFKNPRNVGSFETAEEDIGTGKETSPELSSPSKAIVGIKYVLIPPRPV